MTGAESPTDVDPGEDFPALSPTLTEARNLFDAEEKRQDTLENKASFVFTVSGSLLALLTLAPGIGFQGKIALAIVALSTMALCAWCHHLRDYRVPHGDPDDYYQFAKLDEDEAEDKFLLNYTDAIQENRKTNNRKASIMKIAFWGLFLQFLVLGALLIWSLLEPLIIVLVGI